MSTRRRQTFAQFLRQQVLRDDMIGDIARDYAADHEWHAERGNQRLTFEAFVERLDELHACDGAYDALEAADLQYRSQFDGLRAHPRKAHPEAE